MTRSSACDQHRRGVHGVAIPGSDPHSTTGLQPTVHGITKDQPDHPGGVIRLEAPDSLRGGGFAIPEARQFHRRSCRSAVDVPGPIALPCAHRKLVDEP